jgi:hypothetical protein
MAIAYDFAADLPALLAAGRLAGDPSAWREAAEGMRAAGSSGAASVRDAAQARLWLAWASARYWQPVRIPLVRTTRSRGFPDGPTDVEAMQAWCGKSCRRGWAVEALTATLADPRDAAITFWFEDGAEARRFMLKWMPLRCT